MKKLGLLASLYVAQFLPVAFFRQTFPVFLRQQEVSLELIGLTTLLSLPWTLKFIWSPIVDRYSWKQSGHYKSWIVAMQSILVVALVFCAFLDIQTNWKLLLGCLLLVTFLAATQDIATDALAIGLLDRSERGIGNGIQVAANYLGAILGGGGLLILLDSWGWTRSLLMMAASVCLLLIPIFFHRESLASKKKSKHKHHWMALFNFCLLPGMWRWLLVLFLYTMGTSMAFTMFFPFLVDLGMSLAEIGLMSGVFAYSAGFVAAIVGGFLVKPIGKKPSLILFEILMAIAIAGLLLPTFGFTSLPLLYLLSGGFQFAYSMAIIPMYAIMMDKSRAQSAGSDFTLQTTIVFIGSYLTGTVSGYVAAAIGYRGVFALACAISLVSAVIIAKTDIFYLEESPCDRSF